MSEYIEKINKLTVPLIALKNTVVFPGLSAALELHEKENTAAIAAARRGDGLVVAVTQRIPDIPGLDFDPELLFKIGTTVKLKNASLDENDALKVTGNGISRAAITSIKPYCDYYVAEIVCKTVSVSDNGGPRGEALVLYSHSTLKKQFEYFPGISDGIKNTLLSINDPGLLADYAAAHVFVDFNHKQSVLECFDPLPRLEMMLKLLEREADMLKLEFAIHAKTISRLGDEQRAAYLREQMQVIRNELGEDDDEDREYRERIEAAELPDDVRKKLHHENDRACKLPAASLELALIRNYLDICLELPWNRRTKDRTDLSAAARVLEADHDGLEKVKTRILEYLAVKKLNPELKNQIICLVGPPGTGKTSIAASIARAMKRKLVRVSLGGVNDESDIRGHRRTYVASQPGRIMAAMAEVKVKNPVMLLDEIDKLCGSYHGDPASALLEVLDPEQNKFFRDHYIDMPFDLSECVFICTANKMDTIPRPLADRMEIISLSGYTPEEKLRIAKNHLLPKQAKRHGLNARMLKLSDEAIADIISHYTYEAGVRELERELAAVCRKSAVKIAEGTKKQIRLEAADIKQMLSERHEDTDRISSEDEVGTVNGLAYTEVGGSILKIEVAAFPGTGKLELTGSLGDVIKESARIAVDHIRSIAADFGVPEDFHLKKDLHIHFPAGAVPKDGPSAGIAIVTAAVSALSGKPVRHDIAMTGEVTLLGKVFPIGGLREKVTAAKLAGVKTVIIPYDNQSSLNDIEDYLKEGIEFIPVKRTEEVLKLALIKGESNA